MRIINVANRDIEKHQLFFTECWASMCHVRCLDSDRVSYNNVLNSVSELLDVYLLGDKHRAAEKRKHIVEELIELIESDQVLSEECFKEIPKQLCVLFKAHGDPLENKKSLIISFLEELSKLLKEHYSEVAISSLSGLLMDGADDSEEALNTIYLKTNFLLSHLITLGMPPSECYLLCRNYLLQREADSSFTDAFTNLSSKINSDFQKFSVKLSLDKKSLYELLANASVNTLGDCVFNLQPRAQNARNYYIHVTIEVTAISFSAARALAEKKLLQALDVFSYFLGKDRIQVLRVAHITDSSGVAKPLPRFEKDLENSLDRWIEDDLSVYMNSLSHLRQLGSVKTSKKISAAFRFFQNGLTEQSLESRFTAFWSAIESLTLIEDNSGLRHDEHVLKAVLPCIALDYPLKQLFALRGCSRYLNWEDFDLNGVPFSMQSSNLGDIFNAIKEQAFVDQINARLENYPYAQFRFGNFIKLCTSPFDLALKIEAHKRKVELHIHRLYRVRNAIVHNATSHERLELLVVNLEHYLRSTLNALFYTVEKSKSIVSSEEAFIRYQFEANSIFEEMDPSLKVSLKKRTGEQTSIRNGNVRVSDAKLVSWLTMHG